MSINMLLPFSVLLLSKFEDWNNNLDASLFGMISFSFLFLRNSNSNLPTLVEILSRLTDLLKLGKVQKSILDVFFCLFFQTKTGLPKTLQKKWENKPGFQKSGSMHQHVRWSTCVLVYIQFPPGSRDLSQAEKRIINWCVKLS